MAGKITLSESNKETRIEWKINHFFIREDNLIVSPDFILFKSKWFLQLHLGSKLTFSDTENDFCEPLRMSLLTLNPTTQYHIEYRMGIQACNGSEITTGKFESLLNKGFCQTPQRRKVISRKYFESSRNKLVSENTLTVFCTVRLISAVKPDRDALSPIPSTGGDFSTSLLLFRDERQTTGEITLDESKNETRIEWRINDFSDRNNYSIESPDFVLFNSKCSLEIKGAGRFIKSFFKPDMNSDTNLYISIDRHYPVTEIRVEYAMGVHMPNGSEIRTEKFKETVRLLFKGYISISKYFKSLSDILDSENTLKVFCTVRLLSNDNSPGDIALLGNYVPSRILLWGGTLGGEIILYKSESETRIEWTINHFFTVQDNLMKSPVFILFKSNWFLDIKASKNYLCMRLQRDYCSTADHYIEYRMGIQKSNGLEVITERFESVFQQRFMKSLPMRELISGKDLESLRHTLAHESTLKVFCTVRLLSDDNPSENVQPPIVSTQGSGALYKNTKSCSLTEGNRTLSGNSAWKTENLWIPKFDFNFGKQFKGTATSSECSKDCLSKGIRTLCQNLEDLYRSKRFTDVTIKVKNKEYFAHKAILSSRSKFFASMFEHDTSEKRSNVVDITDCDPHSFENFLLYLYTGKLDTVSSSNATSLFKTADKYGVGELRAECVRCMSREMTVDSFCDVFHLAVLHGEADLQAAATSFFILNASTILIKKEWMTLLEEHPSLCHTLLWLADVQETKT